MNTMSLLHLRYSVCKLLIFPALLLGKANHCCPPIFFVKDFTAAFSAQTLRSVTIQRQFEPFLDAVQVVMFAQKTVIDDPAQEDIQEFTCCAPIFCTAWQMLHESFCCVI